MKKSYLMIRCITTNENKYSNQFYTALTEVITRVYPNSEAVLVQNIPYRKHLNSNEVIYNIVNDAPILVCDFIKIFDLTWIYTDNIVFAVEKNESVREEEAIWSQLNYPLEIFIMPNIKWVDIYTWINE